MEQKHPKFSSAFTINDHAQLHIDRFGNEQYPVARVEGIMMYGSNLMYRLSLFINTDTKENPNPFLHEGLPIDGFRAEDLLPYEGHEFLGKKFGYGPLTSELIVQSNYQIGDLVRVAVATADTRTVDYNPNSQDFYNIPVSVVGITYITGKVLYDVRVNRDSYKDTPAWSDVMRGTSVKDVLTGIDSIYIQPEGGWPANNQVDE